MGRGEGTHMPRFAFYCCSYFTTQGRSNLFFPPLGLELLYICKCDDGSQLFIARVPATLITTTADF